MIQGDWFQSGSAPRIKAILDVGNDQFGILIGDQVLLTGPIDTIQVSDRLADVERKLVFADGSVFATRDNDAVDRAFCTMRTSNGLLHRLESSIGCVLFTLLVTIASSVAF